MRAHGTRRGPGFTLIEAMIVVVIIGVLAVLAVVGYRRWLASSYLSEAQNLVSNMRSAEDTFYSENGVTYLPVSSALGYGNDYPAAKPGAFKTGWGGPCTNCVVSAGNPWLQLAVQPNGAVSYGYSIQTNPSTDYASTPPSYSTPPGNIVVNGSTMNLSAMAGKPWYVIEADGDPLGTGKITSVFAFSGDNHLYINNDTQ